MRAEPVTSAGREIFGHWAIILTAILAAALFAALFPAAPAERQATRRPSRFSARFFTATDAEFSAAIPPLMSQRPPKDAPK